MVGPGPDAGPAAPESQSPRLVAVAVTSDLDGHDHEVAAAVLSDGRDLLESFDA